MPEVKWSWTFTPHTVLAGMQLIAILIAVVGGFYKMQADREADHANLTKLETLVAVVKEAQSLQSERVTRVETKVDLILPAIQRIESNQNSRFPPQR